MRINVTDISEILKDAQIRLNETDVEWYSWPQVWSDTGCGFGGFAGQAITSAQTIVVMDSYHEHAVVYHAGRFAYKVDVNQTFMGLIHALNLPGSADAGKLVKMGIRFSK